MCMGLCFFCVSTTMGLSYSIFVLVCFLFCFVLFCFCLFFFFFLAMVMPPVQPSLLFRGLTLLLTGLTRRRGTNWRHIKPEWSEQTGGHNQKEGEQNGGITRARGTKWRYNQREGNKLDNHNPKMPPDYYISSFIYHISICIKNRKYS